MKLVPFHGVILLEKAENLSSVDGTVQTVLCAMAAEAFLQDIKGYYQSILKLRPNVPKATLFGRASSTTYSGGGIVLPGTQSMEYVQIDERKLEVLIESLEKESPSKKYEQVIRFLNYKWKGGEDESFKNLRRLITIRNNMVHIKSDEINLNESNEITEHSKVLKELMNLKVIENSSQVNSWIDLLDTESFVKWARETVISNVKTVLNLLPDCPISNHFKDSYLRSINTFN